MIFPKKPQVLYAPMLATLGGGSLRSFGRGTGGGKRPPTLDAPLGFFLIIVVVRRYSFLM